jgi:hypothetical protein
VRTECSRRGFRNSKAFSDLPPFESFLEVRIGMLALDGDAKQPCGTGKEFRVSNIELPRVRTINFKDSAT